MAQTYTGADKVLVIDDWLIQTGFYGHPDLDLLKLKSCPWTERLWTLQECILTRKHELHFQTRDGPVAEGEIYLSGSDDGRQKGLRLMSNLIGSDDDSLQESHPDTAAIMIRAMERISDIFARAWENEPISRDLVPSSDPNFPFVEDFDMLNKVMGWSSDFVFVEGRDYFEEMRWQAGRHALNESPMLQANSVLITGECMRFRSTSRVEDEPICFATLLGQDLQDLLGETTVEARMRLVVSKMKHVPIKILFSPRARIDVDGLRWAPLSFTATTTGKGYSPGVAMTTVAQVRPEGLLVKRDGILLNCEHCHDEIGSEFVVGCASALLRVKMTGQTIYAGSGTVGQGLALILWDSSTTSTRTGNDAVLVDIYGTKEGVFFSRFRTACSIGPALQEQQPDDAHVISGRSIDNQQWCVG
jgi:hypothetical protein